MACRSSADVRPDLALLLHFSELGPIGSVLLVAAELT